VRLKLPDITLVWSLIKNISGERKMKLESEESGRPRIQPRRAASTRSFKFKTAENGRLLQAQQQQIKAKNEF